MLKHPLDSLLDGKTAHEPWKHFNLVIFINVSDKRNINNHSDINAIIICLYITIMTMMSQYWQYDN